MSFGTALKQAREAQGLTTQDLALRTKIRGDYLRALEDGNINLLPERTFARSYLQRYARELNLDPVPLLAEFDRSMPVSPEIAQGMRGTPLKETATSGSSGSGLAGLGLGRIAAMLGGLLLIAGGAYYAYTFMKPMPAVVNPTPVTTPTPAPTPEPVTDPAQPAPINTVRLTVNSVPDGARVYLDNRDLGVTPVRSFPVDARAQAELRVEYAGRQPLRQSISLTQGRNLRASLQPAGQGSSSLTDLNNPAKPAGTPVKPPVAVTPAKPAAPKKSAVSVTFTGESWTRITDATGRVLYQGTPPVGSVKGFPAGVIIRTGNAGAIKVSLNGAPAQAMGQPGQVLTKKF